MDLISPTQIIVLAIFLGALMAVLMVVRKFQPQLREKIQTGRNITVKDRVNLGPNNTAFVVRVDDTDFMVITSRRAGASISQLPPTLQGDI